MQVDTAFENNQAGPDVALGTMPGPNWLEAFPALHVYPEELNTQDTPDTLTLEQLTLSSPEERQAGEDAVMAEMSQWVSVGGSFENNQYSNLGDTDGISPELYEQLREKYLGPDYHQSCAGYEFEVGDEAGDAEWGTEMGLDEPFEPMMYWELGDFLSQQFDCMGTRWVNVLEPSWTPNYCLNLPAYPTRQAATAVGYRVVNPFSTQICQADLIRCPDNAPSEDLDNLTFFSRENWKKEVNTLIKAFSNPSNNLTPWAPLSSCFALCYVGTQGISSNRRFKVKRALTKKLEEMAKLRMEESQAAVLELLEAKDMTTPASTWSEVKQAVDENCEKKGSLLFGEIPEFTNQVARSMSNKWPWVD